MTTTTLTPTQLHRTFAAMERSGGGFCRALAAAWYKADAFHKRCIEQAVPHLITEYGPGSSWYVDRAL